MNKLKTQDRIKILSALVEGNSILSTVRMTGFATNTVIKLLVDVGSACKKYQDKTLRNLPCKRIQCDEIWSFVGCKQKNVKDGEKNRGDVWTWTAICADTKIVPCWYVGNRDAAAAFYFMTDLSQRLTSRIQLSTDGHKTYFNAVESVFGTEVDYAQLVKLYGRSANDEVKEVRYSPSQCIGTTVGATIGKPDVKHISTSFCERQNLTMRMSMRRFTRLTNAFSKKMKNHEYAVALHFMHYNFCRIHKSLRVTPAMEAGIADHVWGLEEVVALIS